MSRLIFITIFLFLIQSGCSYSIIDKDIVPPPFLYFEDFELFVHIDQVNLLLDEDGNPVSTEILQDDSLGTVHTFDLFPVIVSAPVYQESDGLWHMQIWLSSGKSIEDPGFTIPIVLGYADTVIEYDLLPSYLFEFKSGNTDTIGNIVGDLNPGDQIFIHVIGEHSFTPEDMAAIAELGFDYPQLVEGNEDTNMAILEALIRGEEPPGGEIRGVGLIYRGVPSE